MVLQQAVGGIINFDIKSVFKDEVADVAENRVTYTYFVW